MHSSVVLGCGWVAQGLFAVRMGSQWLASERAGRSVVPPSFWWLSLTGSLLLVVYAAALRDGVFLSGAIVHTLIYARNLAWQLRGSKSAFSMVKQPSWLLLPLAAVAVLCVVAAGMASLPPELAPTWLVMGVCGQVLWSGRFVVQWFHSEKERKSVLPPAFWWCGGAGALMLLTYACAQLDWVFIVAFALAPLPYGRNLVLLYRRTDPEARERATWGP